jgi:flavin reductase (DIM6/NTAB) family NADH-FMN oxidoreductase RutF
MWRRLPSSGVTDVPPLLDRLDTSACVVTTAYEGRPAGCIVTYVTAASITAARPRLVVLTSHENLTHELLEQSRVLAVHPVARGQEEWVRRFGFLSGRDADKFEGVAWEAGRTGAPLLAEALGFLEGRVLASMDCGDHTARLVEPVAAVLRDPDAVPLRASEIYGAGLDEPRLPSLFPWR